MTETNILTARQDSNDDTHDIACGYGHSSLGQFLFAVDCSGLCAVLLGADRISLLQDLHTAFPNKKPTFCDLTGCGNFVVNAVARLIEQPVASVVFPTSICGGDFKQMVHAALRHTKPGATITPEELSVMIGADVRSAPHVRVCAAEDVLAVVVPFHRLQEQDGTSPFYRWGEEHRQTLLKREAAMWVV